jgi:basic amino acid/polyamine antiporter, APA family
MNGHDRSTTLVEEEFPASGLARSIGLKSAIAVNMNNMIGVGPFITLPLVVAAMGGPQAILGWILGAVLAASDGLVWAELGAAMPHAGGSYRFLKEIYGPGRLGDYLSFLFIWQLTFSAPLSIASGCVGLAQYCGFLYPALRKVTYLRTLSSRLPFFGPVQVTFSLGRPTIVAILCCVAATLLLYRKISDVSRISRFLWIGVMTTMAAIILTGLTHFHPHRAFDMPGGAFRLSVPFFQGLGAALLISTYDYWGAYNICFLGGEVREPERTIPRAILISVAAVAALYLLLNVSVLGVIPWRELTTPGATNAKLSVAAVLMERTYGVWAGRAIAGLVIWTAFASVYTLLLGYSRVPYAAACDGGFFRCFARLHPRFQFPYISLLVLAAVTTMFCTLQLVDIVSALVVVRIVLQFLLQQIGVIVDRVRHPLRKRPFRMWLYPLPALMSIVGFLYILFGRANFGRDIVLALAIVILGTIFYGLRSLFAVRAVVASE